MLNIVRKYDDQPVTEVHIVGGVHPKLTMEFFSNLLKAIKAHRPGLHIKGFTPVELDYMFRKAKLSSEEGMKRVGCIFGSLLFMQTYMPSSFILMIYVICVNEIECQHSQLFSFFFNLPRV